MDLYQDDDVYDFGSPKKPATRAQERASVAVDADDEIEDADDDPERPYKLLNSLKDVRARVRLINWFTTSAMLTCAQIAEERNIVDPAHIIEDDDLFMIATTQPSGASGVSDSPRPHRCNLAAQICKAWRPRSLEQTSLRRSGHTRVNS